MKLHEIIELNECPTTSILIEWIKEYKRSLLIYYTDLFCCEPILMVTDVMNAVQYGKIVPANEFQEAICAFMEVDYIDYDAPEDTIERDNRDQCELISFQSIPLSKL